MKKVRVEELRDSYALKSDEELAALAAERYLLSDEGRHALGEETNRRRLGSQLVDEFRQNRVQETERRRTFKIGLSITFWLVLISPMTPLFIAVVSFQTWVYLWTQHFGAASRGPLEPSANASIAVAIVVWIAIIIIGIARIRELRRR